MKIKLRLCCFLFMFVTGMLLHAQDGFLGEIRMFAGNFAPRGWAFCEGQILAINTNQALFSILGTTYGGDGRTTFALPDLRGRLAVHEGQGAGLSPVQLGQRFGVQSNTLSTNQIPQHTHPMYGMREDGTTATPEGTYMAGTKALDPEYAPGGTQVLMNASVLGTNSTSNIPVENRQPALAVSYIICLQGYFPSRN